MNSLHYTLTNEGLKLDFEMIEEEIRYFESVYSPDVLNKLSDLVDGFNDDRDYEKKQFSIYLRPEETKALKYLALELGESVSISQIVQKACETYEYTKEEIDLFKTQKDRDGSKVSTIHLGQQTRNRHKVTAKGLGLIGNQFYRMCVNGLIKKKSSNSWMLKQQGV